MKTLALILAAAWLTMAPASAQDTNKVDIAQATQARDASLRVHRNIMQRIFGVNVSYSGVFVPKQRGLAAFKPTPQQPFENVSINLETGRAEGINLLSIHF